jgi:hypothetical protein
LITTGPLRINIETVLGIASKGVLASVAMCLFIGWISWLRDKSQCSLQTTEVKAREIRDCSIPYNQIGSGALSLTPRRNSSLIPDLSREIIFIAKSSRPDIDSADGNFLIKVKGSSKPRVVAAGEKVFLDCDNRKEGEVSYSFTSKRTPLWIRPLAAGRSDLSVEVGLFMPLKHSEGFVEEVGQVTLPQHRGSAFDMTEPSYLASIRNLKWWGNDLLYREYGGVEYSSIAQKQKIELKTDSGPSFYFLHPGDCIEWIEGSWRHTPLEKSSLSSPLARIKTITARQLEVEVWDENGFYPAVIKADLQSSLKNGNKNELIGCTARLRSSSQITCMLGKRRLIIKEGDWILKSGKSWKILRRSKDIDDCINHKMIGELFVFDCLEKQQGKLFIKGRLFDEMRTSVQIINIPVSAENANTPKTKRNTPSSMIHKKSKMDVSNAQ